MHLQNDMQWSTRICRASQSGTHRTLSTFSYNDGRKEMGWKKQGRYSTTSNLPSSTDDILSQRLQDLNRSVINGRNALLWIFAALLFVGALRCPETGSAIHKLINCYCWHVRNATLILYALGGRPRNQRWHEVRRTADGRWSRLQDFLSRCDSSAHCASFIMLVVKLGPGALLLLCTFAGRLRSRRLHWCWRTANIRWPRWFYIV